MGRLRGKLLGATVFCCCLWMLQGYLDVLEFDRQLILSGEIWRIWTGHLVHTNTSHFSLNVVAAIIIYFTFLTEIKLGSLLLCSLIFAALISTALLVLYPNLAWYNGMSGLLHALAAYFSVCLARDKDKVLWIGFAIVWGKVLFDATNANSGHVNLIDDMAVITEAHFIGALMGTAVAAILMVHLRRSPGKDVPNV